MHEFTIEIKNEKIRNYRRTAFLIVVLNILFLGYSLLNSVERKSALISLGFIGLYILYRVYLSKKNKHSFFFDEWIFFLLMLLWVDYYLIAIVCMLLFLSYTVSLQKIIYYFDTALIKQKNFPWKKYQWNELSNVMVKDNLLTIDFKNNKIMQAEIINNDINEAQFNNFAKKHLGNGLSS